MSEAIILKASLLKMGELKSGHVVSFKIPPMSEEQEIELHELEKLKGERLYIVVVTEEEYVLMTGDRH
jgi:hypothetical protein